MEILSRFGSLCWNFSPKISSKIVSTSFSKSHSSGVWWHPELAVSDFAQETLLDIISWSWFWWIWARVRLLWHLTYWFVCHSLGVCLSWNLGLLAIELELFWRFLLHRLIHPPNSSDIRVTVPIRNPAARSRNIPCVSSRVKARSSALRALKLPVLELAWKKCFNETMIEAIKDLETWESH